MPARARTAWRATVVTAVVLAVTSGLPGGAASAGPLALRARSAPEVTIVSADASSAGDPVSVRMRRVTSTPVTVSWGDGTSVVRKTRCRAAAAGADLDRCTVSLTRTYAAPGRYRVTVRQGTRVLATRVIRVEAAVAAQPGVVPTLDTVEPTGPSRSPDVVPQPWQAQMLERVNAQRARVGAGPVTLCARLMTAAQRHTDDMHARLYYDHVTPEGLSPRARAEQAGYLGRVGENLSLNPLGGLDLVDDVWANSPGHYANMINPEWTHLGVGYTEDEYNAFFAQEFGVGGVC